MTRRKHKTLLREHRLLAAVLHRPVVATEFVLCWHHANAHRLQELGLEGFQPSR